jgi:hypothetical protein
LIDAEMSGRIHRIAKALEVPGEHDLYVRLASRGNRLSTVPVAEG